MDILTLLAIVSFITGLFSFLWFLPSISVTNSFQLEKGNILSMQFIVSNDSNISIKDVEFSISICKVTTSDGLTINGDHNFTNRIREPNTLENKRVAKMAAGEKNTVQFPVNFNIGKNVNYADLVIIIKFNALYKEWERFFRFKTVTDSDGVVHWKPEPIKK